MKEAETKTIVHHHYILHKPFGYLSQFVNNQTKRKNKKLLGELYDFPEGSMAVGRLDEDSEGLLLITTDGKWSDEIRSRKIEKEYNVQVDGEIDISAINKLKKGVEISIYGKKYQTLPCEAEILNPPPIFPPRAKKIRGDQHGPTSWISITITEGKFRQIRKMTAAVGYPTLRLIRIRIGSVHLKNLLSGKVLPLSVTEQV